MKFHQAKFGMSQLPADEVGQDFPLIIATMPASSRQRAVAVGVIVLLMVAAAVMAPYANIQVRRIDSFIPVLQTVLAVADLLTAIFLFAQFSIQPQRALLALASAYIFSGSFAFLQTLAFPGGYAPDGLIGDGPNTPAWIYVLWHSTFTAAVLVYAISKDTIGNSKFPAGSKMAPIIVTVGGVLATIAVLTWIVCTKTEYLPSFFTNDIRLQTKFGNQVNLALWLWGATATAVLLLRRRTILDLWLIVTLLAYMPSFLVAIIGSSIRFTIGWYAARCFVLVASCMLLSVLIVETIFLYSRLASAIILQGRERANRLLSIDAVTAAIAHELRTPLAAISLNANTARSQLRSKPPELDQMDDILSDIEGDSFRANEIITSIRELSKKTTDRSASTRIEDAVRLILRLLHHELTVHEVAVTTEFESSLPEVHLDSTQLQQVLLNLVKNAVDAMHSLPPEARHLRLTASLNGQSRILLSVEDSGPGIPVEDRERIFDPFFTKKSAGIGLGLAIASSLVAGFGGTLRLAKSDCAGSVFQIEIPASGQHSAK
ncbi:MULTISPECIES: MASE4 domain-containing protein [Bradyrhizobium]|uniref:MASE4 domain-containing protein n=1 Tax=Bradyrhizobium centrosematis TaxID=1300039 RepID=UPI00216A2C9C|nr:MASE4 domain-containing protein [Bradyrhizobium centrosematis]MCS3765776.1 signal transduction histidine kinase [Bradyrhizobium centrosematis]MCS3778002.1 signal transduction histidine kinase [Bradyrhizobium centrosematis]